MEMFTEFVAWASFVFGAFIIGVTVSILFYYTGKRNRWHVAFMAASFIKMSLLMIATINWRVFYSGGLRFVASAVLLLAFLEATIGLILMYRNVTRRAEP